MRFGAFGFFQPNSIVNFVTEAGGNEGRAAEGAAHPHRRPYR